MCLKYSYRVILCFKRILLLKSELYTNETLYVILEEKERNYLSTEMNSIVLLYYFILLLLLHRTSHKVCEDLHDIFGYSRKFEFLQYLSISRKDMIKLR